MNSISINDDNSINDNHNSDSDKPKPPRPTPDAAETPTDLSTRIAFASENSPRTEPIPADPGGLYARLKDDPKDARLTRETGGKASIVMRTAGAVRVFEHADDQKITEGSYIPC